MINLQPAKDNKTCCMSCGVQRDEQGKVLDRDDMFELTFRTPGGGTYYGITVCFPCLFDMANVIMTIHEVSPELSRLVKKEKPVETPVQEFHRRYQGYRGFDNNDPHIDYPDDVGKDKEV